MELKLTQLSRFARVLARRTALGSAGSKSGR